MISAKKRRSRRLWREFLQHISGPLHSRTDRNTYTSIKKRVEKRGESSCCISHKVDVFVSHDSITTAHQDMKGKYQRDSGSRKQRSSSLAAPGPYMGLCESRSLHLVPCLCGEKWGNSGGCWGRQKGGEHLAIIKSLEKIRFVENQTEGLLEMIQSLRKHGMDTEGSRDRAEEWVKLGALGHMVDIASQLDIEVDESRVRLVCVATAVLLRACPGDAVTIYKFLECVWGAISQRAAGRGAMAVYRLFFTMLDQPEIRQAAIEAGFVNLLQARFRLLSSENGLGGCRVTAGGDAGMGGRFRDDLFRWQSSSGVERISRQPSSRSCHPVPRLNLGWRGSWRRGPSEGLSEPSFDEGKYAGLCNTNTRGTSNRGLFVAAELRMKLVPPSSQVSFGRRISSPGNFEPTLRSHGLFNKLASGKCDAAAEDTLLLWEQVQHCTFHSFGDPRIAWDLPKDLLFSDTSTKGVLMEKTALLEACLILSPMGHPGGAGLIADPTDMVIEEMCSMAENGRVERGLVKCCGALMGEYSASLARVGVGTEAAEVLPDENWAKSVDRFMSFVGQRIRTLLEEGKSSGVFPDVAPYINLLRMYLKDSPSIQPATSFLAELGGVFGGVERSLVAHGNYKVQSWPSAQLKTFSELLKLYIIVLERTGHSRRAESFVKRLMRDQVFLHLVREYGKWLVWHGRHEDVSGEERETWHGVLWSFLTELMVAVEKQINLAASGEESEKQNIGWEHCFRKGERELSVQDLKQWEFLLRAKTGFVSLVLANRKWGHAGEGMDRSIHAKVVGFVKAWFSVPDSVYRDTLLVNFYIQLHAHRFRSMYERTAQDLAPEEWELCNLHLEVVLTIIKHRQSHVLAQLQHFKFVEYLTEEISTELKRTELVPVANANGPPGGRFPEIFDPLFQKSRSLSSVSDGWDSAIAARDRSWGNNLKLQKFKLESQKLGAKQRAREEEMSIEEIEKIVYDRDSTRTRGVDVFKKMGILTSPPASVESLETIKVPDLHTNRWSSPLKNSGAGRCKYDLPSQSTLAEWSREETSEGEESPGQHKNSGRERMGSHSSGSVFSEGESDEDDDEGLPPSRIVRRPFCVPPLALKSFKKPPESPSNASDGIPSAPTCSADLSPRIERNDAVHATVVDILLEYFLLADETQGSQRARHDLMSFLGDLSRTLFHHLNAHQRFGDLEKRLKDSARLDGTRKMLLLRMFLTSGFDISPYKPVDRIHHGERAQVQRCHVLTQGDGIPSTCVVKAQDFPMDHALHRCILDMLSEIAVLQKMRSVEGFCQLYDFGASAESIFLVMKDYPCSLLEWRNRVLPKQEPHSIRLLLRIFRDILCGVEKMHSASIVHFDLKCSNILLDPDAADDQFWNPDTEMPPFSSVISDFGEARCYEGKQAAATGRHRGTEQYQSPEMLKLRPNSSGDFDRRQTEKGAGFPCDVWALGCLLYEMITGEVLQLETVFMKFYCRVTGSGVPVIDEAKARLLHESYRSEIIQLLEFILVRDQNWRPSIARVIERVDEILNKNTLPAFEPMHNTLGLKTAADCSKEKAVFRDGLSLGLGMTDLTERVSVFLGSDMHKVLDSTFLLRNGVSTILLTKDERCGENGGGVSENVVLGMCSRMNIEGVFLVDLAKDEWDGEMSGMKKNMGLEKKLVGMDESKQGRVLICGSRWCVGLVDFTVMVLNKLEGMSNFDALLTIKREGL
ncbi:hypothetical protein BSKO_00150 [Bryopsis sp. KO-2023]|nr:hypothetical protein BSKO_00150 [Bryopsis sp. KO-2023]